MKERQKGMLMVFIAGILWSTGGMLMKNMTWNGPANGGIRSLISALFLLPFVSKVKFKFTKWRLISMCSYAYTVVIFAVANKMTTAANAIMLQYTAPIYAAILGVLIFREKLYKRDIISIILIMFGMVLFVGDGLQGGHLMGDIIAVSSGISFALVPVSYRKLQDEDPVELVFWGNIVSFLVTIPFMRNITLTPVNIGTILALGIGQLGTAYILFSRGAKYISPLESVLICMIEPILNPVWTMMLVGEVPSLLSITGGIIIIVGVLFREVVRIHYEKKQA